MTFPGQTSAIPLNAWTHLAITYDGSAVTGYVNGQSVGSVAAAGVIRVAAGSAAALMIGNEPQRDAVQPGGFAWDGLIDEVAFYDRALTAAQVQAVYAAGAAGNARPADFGNRFAVLVTDSGSPARAGGQAFDVVVTSAPASGLTTAGTALRFTGSEYVEVPGTATVTHSDRRLTASGWFKVDSFAREWQNVLFKGVGAGTNSDNREYALWVNQTGYLHATATAAGRVGWGRRHCTPPAG